LRRLIEAGVLALVCLSPWAFGAVEPIAEFCLYAGLCLLLGLWGARMLVVGEISWGRCPVALCLVGLILLGAWQLLPLPSRALAGLSPATARLYDQLLPPQPEILPRGEAREPSSPPPGSTISLYPGQTRHEVMRLLAVLALFAVVRNNIAPAAGLRRLSVAALVVGSLLSLLALIQFFTSPPYTIYWSYPTPGHVFGPFVNKNHFGFYVNLCVGLAVGLLYASGRHVAEGAREGLAPTPGDATAAPLRQGPGARRAAQGSRLEVRSWVPQPLSLLQHPKALWVCAALALMLSAVVFCLSRGAIVSLLVSSALYLMVRVRRSWRLPRHGAGLLMLVLALGLLAWFGFGPVQARLATLWGDKALQEFRLKLWSQVLPLAKDFPLWGTGYGTFQYVEPLRCYDWPRLDIAYTNAENDYLEALVEGGVFRLAVSLLAIAFVFRLGYRAAYRYRAGRTGELALGGLFGFATVVVHSFFDFGLHIPAIALLATVLCALLCALADSEEQMAGAGWERPASRPGRSPLRLGGLASVLGAVTAVVLGLVVCHEGWQAYKTDSLRDASFDLGQPLPGRAGLYAGIARLKEATCRAPADARLHLELAQLYLQGLEDDQEKLQQGMEAAQAAGTWALAWPPASAVHTAAAVAVPWAGAVDPGRTALTTDREELVHTWITPYLRYLLRARDLCPLLVEPHRYLANCTAELEQADSRVAYLGRVTLLVPYDPALWCMLGNECLAREPDRACASWRRSLELSDDYLPVIIKGSAGVLGPQGILDRVLPDKPGLLLAAAAELYPDPGADAGRRPFLAKALALLAAKPTPLTGEDFHTRAAIQRSLGRPALAVAAYEASLAREPGRVDWRYEFAELLHEQGRLPEARRELVAVLAWQPGHAPARQLREVVARETAEGKRRSPVVRAQSTPDGTSPGQQP
jgi:tetratricopeptide (TPR) repeat protein